MRELLLLLVLTGTALSGCSEPAQVLECERPDGYSRALEIQVQYPERVPASWPPVTDGTVTLFDNGTAKKVGHLDAIGCTWINAQPGTYWLWAAVPFDNCHLANGTEVQYVGEALRVNMTGLQFVC